MGVELLGRAFDDARIVTLAYAYEEATHWRRAPRSTPSLVNGRAPAPRTWNATAVGTGPDRADAHLTFDPARGTLDYAITLTGIPADQVHAVAVRTADAEGRRSVVLRIAGPGVLRAHGSELLTPNLREWLEAGALSLEVFTRAHPFGSARVGLAVPR